MEQMDRRKDNNMLILESIKFIDKIVTNVDELNKRLVTALVVVVLAFSFTIFGTAWLYFRTDYDYPSINQEQTNEQSVKVNGGGD